MSSMVEMIRGVRAGDRTEFDLLFASLYDELRRVASRHLRDRSPGQTLDTTALIHEAYLRMVDQSQAEWADRAHFFAYASRAVRAVLVDYARRRGSAKRGGGSPRFSLEDRDLPVEQQSEFLLALDEALTRLGAMSDRLASTVECRFFGGMTEEETAAVLEVSDRTVRRDWLKAKAWLYAELSGEAP
ncbi:MAG TPA: sigma-70 family RNA polymerase sigma factor [Gemmatimonadales bacterium]|nr:sigma-70 family RNA polymerase sigma factor [Gemmatimonadales bacterium]